MKKKLALLFGIITFFLSYSNCLCAPESDRDIVASIKNSYTFKTYLQDEDIKVISDQGVVTLRGIVQDQYHKLLARDTASNTPGVERVIDQLKTRDEDQAGYSDAILSMKVKSALLLRFNEIPIIRVYVKDGVVTLRGDVPGEKEKKLAEGYAKDVDGVKGLINELKIVPQTETLGEKIDDASITAQAKFLLLLRYPKSALKVGVHTEDGVVTLSGPVANPDEKKMINELVGGIRGTKKVIDDTALE